MAGAHDMQPVPLGSGWAELVEAIYAGKFRYCILQAQDVGLLLLCSEEGSDVKRQATKELQHGTSMRIALYWLIERCPHHGEAYTANRWASLKVFADVATIIRAQGYKGEIRAKQVLGVIKEFGPRRK